MVAPLYIEIVLHYHVCPSEHPQISAPATKTFIGDLVREGILEPVIPKPASDRDASYKVTDKGQAWVKMICTTPFPEQRWVDPRD